MDPSNGKMDALTQYQRDNPGFRHFPVKLGALTPQPDNLQLFAGPQQTITENRASYKCLENAPRPRTSCKKEQQRHANSGQFNDRTSFKTDYQPIPLEKMLAQAEIYKQAAAIGATYKMGLPVKRPIGSISSTGTLVPEFAMAIDLREYTVRPISRSTSSPR